MGWLASVTALFKAVGAYFGFAGKQQERDNAPDIIANKDARRDQKEEVAIQHDVESGDKTGDLTKEREDFSD